MWPARVIDRVFAGFAAENKRLGTIQTVVKFAVQAWGGLAIVFVIFGMPSETTTILGLAGAGLTVALKDFIVAFFGWFVLMGGNQWRFGRGGRGRPAAYCAAGDRKLD